MYYLDTIDQQLNYSACSYTLNYCFNYIYIALLSLKLAKCDLCLAFQTHATILLF